MNHYHPDRALDALHDERDELKARVEAYEYLLTQLRRWYGGPCAAEPQCGLWFDHVGVHWLGFPVRSKGVDVERPVA